MAEILGRQVKIIDIPENDNWGGLNWNRIVKVGRLSAASLSSVIILHELSSGEPLKIFGPAIMGIGTMLLDISQNRWTREAEERRIRRIEQFRTQQDG